MKTKTVYYVDIVDAKASQSIVSVYHSESSDEAYEVAAKWNEGLHNPKCIYHTEANLKAEVYEVEEPIEEVKDMKKYTLENYKEFCNNALQVPPIEEFENGSIDEEKWYKENKIHIVVGEHDIEIDYLADSVNEVEFALREMYEAIEGDGEATTGNTVGSEYRDATWKDILRLNILREFWNGHTLKNAIHMTVGFTHNDYTACMKFINTPKFCNDDFGVNFFRLSSNGMENLFNKEAREKAIKEMLCSNIEIEELIDKDGKHGDKVVITDYSIKPSGDIVGWHYGVDFDKDSANNQYYINKYIKEMMK